MTEINIEEEINAEIVINATPEDVEDHVNKRIRDALSEQIVEALDDMAYVDMEYNQETNMFDVTASLVLCAKNDIATNMQVQAQIMKQYGLDPEQIETILNAGIETTGGF